LLFALSKKALHNQRDGLQKDVVKIHGQTWCRGKKRFRLFFKIFGLFTMIQGKYQKSFLRMGDLTNKTDEMSEFKYFT